MVNATQTQSKWKWIVLTPVDFVTNVQVSASRNFIFNKVPQNADTNPQFPPGKLSLPKILPPPPKNNLSYTQISFRNKPSRTETNILLRLFLQAPILVFKAAFYCQSQPILKREASSDNRSLRK